MPPPPSSVGRPVSAASSSNSPSGSVSRSARCSSASSASTAMHSRPPDFTRYSVSRRFFRYARCRASRACGPRTVRRSAAIGASDARKLNRSGGYRRAIDDDLTHGDGQREATRPGAAGIHEQYATALLNPGLVGMPRDHRANARRGWLDAEPCEIMNGVDWEVSHPHQLGLVERLGPRAAIVIASYGRDRSDRLQLGQDARVADVARMNDDIAPRQERFRLRSEKTVRI